VAYSTSEESDVHHSVLENTEYESVFG